MCTKSDLDDITTSVKDAALNIFANKLSSIILYGSYARNDYSPESDIDIMLLLDVPADKLNIYNDEITKLSGRLSLESEDCVTVSIVMQDIETFERYKALLPYFRSISDEGVVVYAA
jgi:predicted nucleotidyltransferase